MKLVAAFMQYGSGLRGLALAVACATMLSGCLSTSAQPQFMPLGRATMAPQGFLQFCAHEPQQCGASLSSSSGDTEKQMMQKQWAAIFAPAPATIQPAPQPVLAAVESPSAPQTVVNAPNADAPPFLRVALSDQTETKRYDWTPIFGPSGDQQSRPAFEAPNPISSALLRYLVEDGEPTGASATSALSPPFEIGSADLQPLAPAFLTRTKEAGALSVAPYVFTPSVAAPITTVREANATPAGPSQPLRVDSALMKQLIDINTRVNAAISPASDMEAFGANDVWALPLEDGGPARGNCKHYALEKQHALTQAGLPASNLSLAIVRTRWGELHAVLLVRTDQGELVLDNLTPSIRSWRDVDYTWIERQKPNEPLVWVALATASSGRG